MKLTTLLHLVPILTMCGSKPLLPLPASWHDAQDRNLYIIYLFIYLFIHSFIHLLMAYLTVFNSSNFKVLNKRTTWDNEPITKATWPVASPTAEHSRHICVSAVLCVFLLSSAGKSIARSATKCQKEIQKSQKHQPLSYIDLSCHKDRLQKTN